MTSALAPVWFNFFLEAGIPPSDAGNYAVTFTQNRIQPDMMTDLTKDYLAEMGITVLGDVIAILKHARMVHTQATREKALQFTGLSREIPSSEIQQLSKLSEKQTLASATNPVKAASKAVHTVKTTGSAIRLRTSDDDSMLTSQSLPKPGVLRVQSQPKEISSSKPVSVKASSSVSTQNARTAPVVNTASVLKTTKLNNISVSQSNGSATRLRTPVSEGAAVTSQSLQKAGLLKITANVGEANAVQSRHKAISTSKAGSGETKTSVFNRLGQEVANSDKVPLTTASSKTTFRVTMQGLTSEEVIPTQSKSASIFQRLGNRTNVETRLVSGGGRVESPSTPVTAAAGRITSPAVRQTTVRNLGERLGPVRNAVSVSTTETKTSQGIFGSENGLPSAGVGTGGASIKLRLGVKRPASTEAAELPSQPSSSKKAAAAGVKARLRLNSTVRTSEAEPVAALVKPPLKVHLGNSKVKTAGVFGRLGSLKR